MSESKDESVELSHVESDERGLRSRMVDVSGKSPTRRTALARARVRFPTGILSELMKSGGPKGPIEEVARVAGIQGAKRTADLIPMCHPLGLDHIDIRFGIESQRSGKSDGDERNVLEITCRASTHGPTGVEMEAMTGATVAALTVYDMTKALSKGITIESVELIEKTGGKSGDWRRGDD